MDEADHTSLVEDKLLELRIAAARGIPVVIKGSGHCLFCGDAVEFGRWCDKECRNDWERGV